VRFLGSAEEVRDVAEEWLISIVCDYCAWWSSWMRRKMGRK
jgi:hypothetical protein